MSLISKIALMLLIIFTVQSCEQAPVKMYYFVNKAEPTPEILWPSLPEIPRYRYAGQLLGQQNYQTDETVEPGTWQKIIDWITGVDSDSNKKSRTLVRPQTGMVSGNRIFVTDIGRGAVFVFDREPDQLFIWEQADRGEQFISPIGIAEGSDNTILVADSELARIVILSAQGEPQGSFGEGLLSRPTGLVRDPVNQRIYVSDTHAHDIKVFDDGGRLISKIGKRGTVAGEFNAPTHIYIEQQQLYVTDTLNARVQVLSLDGKPVRSIGKNGLYLGNLIRPKGVTVDADGNVYIVESYYDHLLVFNNKGEFLLPIGGTGSAVGHFYLPTGIWRDQQGRIYIADMYNARVIVLQYLGT